MTKKISIVKPKLVSFELRSTDHLRMAKFYSDKLGISVSALMRRVFIGFARMSEVEQRDFILPLGQDDWGTTINKKGE